MMNKAKGFSLIELMIVVAIIGIVGAVALPSYDKFMIKSRRADDAQAHLSKIVDRQERFYLQNSTYTDVFGATGLNIGSTSDDGYYTFAITLVNSGAGFTVTATPVAGLAQAKDVDCTSLTLSSTGLKTATAGTGGDATKCW